MKMRSAKILKEFYFDLRVNYSGKEMNLTCKGLKINLFYWH